ncbi:hypothetical protein [Pseudocnuella soli]|uniref:hypothetical protein n=1 Tax=Pseudocnuella soli TaxID=2502779 RepID=UPI001048FF4E|nr:hypothetical protein [Pseudocnuella soli]
MMLYATTLMIDDFAVPYQVYKEGNRLFFKPMALVQNGAAPLFWVAESGGLWEPMNIQDEQFKTQIKDNIARHQTEVRAGR